MTSRSSAARFRLARLASASCGLALALASSSALAQQPGAASNCPPGSWFCADTQEKPAAPPGQPVAPQRLEPLPGTEPAAPPPPPQVIYQQSPPVVYQMPPPVVLYQPAPQPQQAPPPPPPPPVYRPSYPSYESPPPYYYRPRPAEPVARPREWGLNLRIEGAIMGHDAANNSGMGGLGFGLRYKPVPFFGLEADVDFWGGRDYYGNQRQETAFALNTLFFVNPKSKVQLYFLAGIGWSSATVNDDSSINGTQANYSYFGGQAGGGLEFRLGRHFALNGDVRGFIRGRTDNGAQTAPEYVDPTTGRTTNTSGGAIITGGMTFYF
jgi:hypothetical protein